MLSKTETFMWTVFFSNFLSTTKPFSLRLFYCVVCLNVLVRYKFTTFWKHDPNCFYIYPLYLFRLVIQFYISESGIQEEGLATFISSVKRLKMAIPIHEFDSCFWIGPLILSVHLDLFPFSTAPLIINIIIMYNYWNILRNYGLNIQDIYCDKIFIGQ